MKLFELHAPTTSKEIASLIKSNCSDMITAYQSAGKALLRGIGKAQGTSNPLVMGAVRADRRPSATPQANFELINQGLELAHLPTRANTISTSAFRKEAQAWGPVHVLFMKNGWHGLCFEHSSFDDLYVQSEVLIRKNGTAEDMEKVIQKFRPVLISSSTDLAKALDQRHEEIIMQGTQYYALRANSPITAEVLKELSIDLSNL